MRAIIEWFYAQHQNCFWRCLNFGRLFCCLGGQGQQTLPCCKERGSLQHQHELCWLQACKLGHQLEVVP